MGLRKFLCKKAAKGRMLKILSKIPPTDCMEKVRNAGLQKCKDIFRGGF